MSSFTWDQTQTALQAAIVTAAALPDSQVIWAHQNGDAPPNPYVSMGLRISGRKGQDWVQKIIIPDWAPSTSYIIGDTVLHDDGKRYQCIKAGNSQNVGGPTGTGQNILDGTVRWNFMSAEQQIMRLVKGVREVGLDLQCFTVDTTGGGDAIALLERIKTALLLDSVRKQFSSVGVSPFGPGEVQYVPEVVGADFRGRAECTIRCYMPAQAVFEFVTYIQRFGGTLTYGTDKTRDYLVP